MARQRFVLSESLTHTADLIIDRLVLSRTSFKPQPFEIFRSKLNIFLNFSEGVRSEGWKEGWWRWRWRCEVELILPCVLFEVPSHMTHMRCVCAEGLSSCCHQGAAQPTGT